MKTDIDRFRLNQIVETERLQDEHKLQLVASSEPNLFDRSHRKDRRKGRSTVPTGTRKNASKHAASADFKFV
jgi:hypothetical protein